MSQQLPIWIRSYNALSQESVAESEIPAQIAQGLSRKDFKLIDLVKLLGETLTSEVDAVRARGIGLLSSVVLSSEKTQYDRQSTKTLTSFFVDKLDDGASMVACAKALTALTESPAFGSGEAIEVAKGIFTSVKLQKFPQPTRVVVYTLLDALMSRHRAGLIRMGKNFISGYCALVEGEKDPRNLMLSFSIVHVILLEFDIADSVEDLFDITFCYFPITFTPPADDPYGITSEDLIVALRKCLSATPLFGKLALPLFLDKLQAASEKAKRQTLQAVTACFPIYGAQVCGEWADRFSEALSIEILQATDEQTSELALIAMQSLFATLYPDAKQADKTKKLHEDDEDEIMTNAMTSSYEIEGVALKVVSHCLQELSEPDKSNAKPAVKLLAALIPSSNRLGRYILNLAIPHLLKIYKDQDEILLRPSVLSCLSELLSALSPPQSADAAKSSLAPIPLAQLDHANGNSPLEVFRDDLLSIFSSATRSATTRSPGSECLVNLIKIENFLSTAEVEFCVSALNEILSSPETDSDYFQTLENLIQISNKFPQIIETTTLPILFSVLPSEAPGVNSETSREYRRALTSLAGLCTHPDLFESLALRILARLGPILAATDKPAESSLYAHHLLVTLSSVLKLKASKKHEDIPKYLQGLVPRLLDMFLQASQVYGPAKPVAQDSRLLLDAGTVITIILQRVDLESQTKFCTTMDQIFHSEPSANSKFSPFSPNSPRAQQETIILYTAAMLPMRPTVTREAGHLLSTLRQFVSRSLEPLSEAQMTAGLQYIASTVNKHAPELSDFFSNDLKKLWQNEILLSGNANLEKRKAGLKIWLHAAKGLIVRSDERGYEMISSVLELFADAQLARGAAIGLSVIPNEDDKTLSKENFAVIRLLYKQRFFSFLLPKLVAGYQNAAANQAIYLTALSSLLQFIPRQLTLTELPKLLPLLVTALDLPDQILRANVIASLSLLAKEVSSEMEPSINNLVTKILKILTNETSNSDAAIKLRLASLQFLGVLPKTIPYMKLHPQKPIILKQLGKAVDDPKRQVRRAAVDCRSRWYTFGGST